MTSSRPAFRLSRCSSVVLPLSLCGCAGVQSALAPEGLAAREIAALWWTMAAGAALIFIAVLSLAIYAIRSEPGQHRRLSSPALIIGGGVILPVVALSALLIYSFMLGVGLTQPAASDALRITVIGRQWWWEVHYHPAGSTEQPIISANELHIPAGEPVELRLQADDVIHSFWAPSLAGKMDMIPGQTNRLVIQADEPGVFRGQCAEYCGGPHALMAFYVIATPAQQFSAWLERERQPAQAPADAVQQRGLTLFLDSGCGACHTIRGTPADGRFGPDLTHVGNRRSLAAGILPVNLGTLAGWIADSQHIKPDNRMPSFNTFDGETLRTLAAYLESLK